MLVEADHLKRVAVDILKSLKAADHEAEITAASLVQADARGIDTHGVHLLTLIAQRAKAGMIRIPTELKVITQDGAVALLDGGNGLGQPAVDRAMITAMERARSQGVGVCSVRNTNNIGILSFYTLRVAKEGFVGVVMSNAAPAMSPWGGAEAFFGTNPLSIAVPTTDGSRALVLDMSSTVVARGKIRRAQRLKEPIPEGWALDEEGVPTRDAVRALKGTLMPIGGAKGYGLALMIDILAGLLSGSSFGPQVKTFHEPLGPTGVGVLTLVLDVERFMPRAVFDNLMQGYLQAITSSRKAKGVSRIYLPGEIEGEKERESLVKGIELNQGTADKLNELLEEAKSPLRLM